MALSRQKLSLGLLLMFGSVAVYRFFSVPSPVIAQDAGTFPVHPVAPDTTAGEDTARSQRELLLQLYTRKLELMNAAQMEAELRDSQQAVAQLEASKKLDSILSQLTELTEMYPGTSAASVAQRMLSSGNAPQFGADLLDGTPAFRGQNQPVLPRTVPTPIDPVDSFQPRPPVRTLPQDGGVVPAAPISLDPLEPAFSAPPSATIRPSVTR